MLQKTMPIKTETETERETDRERETDAHRQTEIDGQTEQMKKMQSLRRKVDTLERAHTHMSSAKHQDKRERR